jgi:hypothetical protein
MASRPNLQGEHHENKPVILVGPASFGSCYAVWRSWSSNGRNGQHGRSTAVPGMSAGTTTSLSQLYTAGYDLFLPFLRK